MNRICLFTGEIEIDVISTTHTFEPPPLYKDLHLYEKLEVCVDGKASTHPTVPQASNILFRDLYDSI